MTQLEGTGRYIALMLGILITLIPVFYYINQKYIKRKDFTINDLFNKRRTPEVIALLIACEIVALFVSLVAFIINYW